MADSTPSGPAAKEQPVDEPTGEKLTVGELTVEQKVGQLFHVGFHERDVTDELASVIDEYHVGGVIYFSRNIETPEQTRELSTSLQDIAIDTEVGVPLLISVDQEGGSVRRLPFYTEVPGQMALGATGDPKAAARVAEITAAQLRSIGVNLNLAPVLDVNSNPENPVIGARSYGETPDIVGEFGARYVEALQEAGVMACGKHFPGHGDTSTDSHADLPLVDASESRLQEVELAPFVRAIDAGIDSIMTAHVSFPAITGSETRPATLSRDVLTGLLREELGFDGLIATDAMEMDAIADGVGTERGVVEAISAGANVIYVCHDHDLQRRSIEAVIEAVERGELAESRLDEAVQRVLSFKRRRDLRPASPTESLDTDAHDRTVREIAKDAVTVVRDRTNALPLSATDPVALFAARPQRSSPAEDERTYVDTVVHTLNARGFAVQSTDFGRTDGDGVETPDVSTIPDSTQVCCCTFNAAADPSQVETVQALVDAGLEPVVVAVNNPYDLRALPDLETYMTTYDPTQTNLEILVSVLSGAHVACGEPPESLR